MSAYDICIYGYRARYSCLRCRVRYPVIHDFDFVYIVHDIAPDIAPRPNLYRYIPRSDTISCNTISCISRYRDSRHRVFHDIVIHDIVKITISWFTQSCISRYRVSRNRVFHDIVNHDIVNHDIVKHDIVYFTMSWNTISWFTISWNTRYREKHDIVVISTELRYRSPYRYIPIS
jgi:hypothetical protein